MEPNKERIQLLVDALRSDEFTQACGGLTKIFKDGHTEDCCLGVACHVAKRHGAEVTLRAPNGELLGLQDSYYGTWSGHEQDQIDVLPNSVAEWYGFEDNNPCLVTTPEGICYAAATLNDTLKWNYNQIAEAFERKYLQGE